MRTISEDVRLEGSHHGNPAETLPLEGSAFLENCASRFGTPFYLYDADSVEAQVDTLRSVLPLSDIFFSFKSNPNPAVARLIQGKECRADLTSPGEIEAALSAGFPLSEALYGGPGKSRLELRIALEAGIRHFSVESENDLQALNEAAEELEVSVRALIRINPREAPKAKLAMSGVASQFGFEEDYLHGEGSNLLDRVGAHVHLVGVHIYWGTQVGGAEELLACFTATVRIASEVSDRIGFPLEIVNLGGGFPWPYSKAGEGPNLSPLKDELAKLRSSSKAEWWFESGRFLTAPSGTLVTRVMDIKESKDEKLFLILDTGIHHLGGMSGLGRIPRFSIDLEVPSERKGNEEVTVDVVGQLCTPLDCIGRRISLPKVEEGDLLTIPNTGAYGPTASVLGFLSRPTPAEIVHRGGEVVAATRIRSGHESIV
ncbi:MAG: type III PLP-dependent enzyme [Verrucomicrobiota bacterium]